MAQQPAHHRRALIVEDEVFFAMGLEADMQRLGFETCDLAADGQAAFLKAMSNRPDIVSMDVNLKGWQTSRSHRAASMPSRPPSRFTSIKTTWG
jgi:DNA-binding response OmpR family regulator